MSKLRPSTFSEEASLIQKAEAPVGSGRIWHGQIFKNTFTRNGRRIKLKHWSVKIQHQRRRRTFSLLPSSRAQALKEAQEIHRMILEHGWETAIHFHQLRKLARSKQPPTGDILEQPMSKASQAYWQQRLIECKYTEAKLTPGREWTVRIEHGGNYHYFPLGTDDRAAAAIQALKIYLAVVEKGWKAACQQFSREITLAIFWAVSPVAVTYTTIYSILEKTKQADTPAPARSARKKGWRVAIVEPDGGLKEALVFWLNRQPGFECNEIWISAEEALSRLEHRHPDMILVNRLQPGMRAMELVDKLKARFPQLPVFTYGIYEDSDQIFIRVSGVRTGYIFKRRTPGELLEPILGAFKHGALDSKEVFTQIKNYFQSFFGGESSEKENLAMANLTDRELKVLNCVSKGYLDKEIAHELGISLWTVHNHLKNTYEKLNVHTRTEAALKYLQK